MAELIRKAFLNFNASGSLDVIGYALYYQAMPDVVDRASTRIDLGNPTPDVNGVISVELSALPGMTTLDGRYNLGVSTVDDANNESSIITEGLEDIPLDFTAPDPPSNANVSFI